MKPRLVIADKNHRIFDVPSFNATGAKAGIFSPLHKDELIKLPYGSELFILPDRYPVGYDDSTGEFVPLKTNPFSKKRERWFAVAAFISPGYTATYSTAYLQDKRARLLPLFSYSPVAYYKHEFYVPAVRVDRDRRQDLRLMSIKKVRENVRRFGKKFGKNRLFHQLVRCATVYSCPAGKNFFLQRYECPLPTSPRCNSRCVGCISLQTDKALAATQPRICFTPTPQEIAEVALFHIENVKRPVVSFGQGCEGEPLMVGDVLLESVRLIRKDTKRGTINLNTNASKPEVIKVLFGQGLDSIRVSISSVQEAYYNAYYRPLRYSFKDVLRSIRYAKNAGGFVSINYLTMPGFTDHKDEVKALLKFLGRFEIDMIQWRNLNYDPSSYTRLMKLRVVQGDLVGIRDIMNLVRSRFPGIKFGYFNPPKEKWSS